MTLTSGILGASPKTLSNVGAVSRMRPFVRRESKIGEVFGHFGRGSGWAAGVLPERLRSDADGGAGALVAVSEGRP
jgi:hypothetical protein